jgi:hypothetical protein
MLTFVLHEGRSGLGGTVEVLRDGVKVGLLCRNGYTYGPVLTCAPTNLHNRLRMWLRQRHRRGFDTDHRLPEGGT